MAERTAPRATIGLTCFNAEATIERALKSALAQRGADFEVIVADDRSSDGSLALVERVAQGEPRVRVIRREENGGPAAARNSILDAARGEFVVFFDDDDESLPDRAAVQIAAVEAAERRTGAALVACYASGLRRYPNGFELELPAIGSRGQGLPHGPAVADWLLYFRRDKEWFFGSGTPTCALCARRSTFAAVGGFDASLRRLEDVDFAIRLALAGGWFAGSPERLFIQYSTGAPDKSPEKNLDAEQRLADKNEGHLRAAGRYYYARHWPKLRYWHFKRRYDMFLLELAGLLLRHPVATVRHLLATGPARLAREQNMRASRNATAAP